MPTPNSEPSLGVRSDPAWELLKALVEKLDAIAADPQFQSMAVLDYVHGRRYTGPNWAEELAAAKTYLAESSASSLWRDIASAPKDGTRILAHGVLGAVVVRWSDYAGEEGRPAWTDGKYTYSPTHWMPLPAPPSPEGR